MTVNVLTAAGDVLITVLLCWMLQTSRTGFRKSNTMINKLVSVIISMESLSVNDECGGDDIQRQHRSFDQIYIWPTTFIYIAFYFCTGRLYCNALLATLNTRRELRGDAINEDLSLSFRSRGAQRIGECTTLGTSQKCLPNNISIKIDTTHECISDEQYPSLTGNVKAVEAV
ncbi:hypothetical protein J3R82DRAFT_9286 [Butyriboletus roseoflavus]|nr:hypothetical protein J3R82DRAFT_9286 [Butyriboletus roseoflavus]